MPDYTIPAIALIVGFVACVTDLRDRRIPNALTCGAALAALLFHGWTGAWSGVQTAVSGWFLGVAVFLPFFLLRGMGGGDVKLLAALGAWLGPQQTIWLAVYTSLAGGACAIIVALANGYLMTAIRNIWNVLVYWSLVGPRPLPEMTLERSPGPRLAYAIPIFAGTVVTLWRG